MPSQPPIDVSDAAQQRRDALQGAEYRRQQQQEMEAEKEMLAAQYPGCVLCTDTTLPVLSRHTHTLTAFIFCACCTHTGAREVSRRKQQPADGVPVEIRVGSGANQVLVNLHVASA